MSKKIKDDERALNGFLPSPEDDRDYTLEKMCMMSALEEE